MGYKDVTAGTKTARALAMRFIQAGEKKTLGVEVSFEFEEPSTGSRERLSWQGWLTEKAIQRTMETLTNVLEFNGDETHNAEGVLTNPKVLSWTKDVQLVVEMETNPDNNKTYPKVKWVNNLSGSGYSAGTPEVIKSQLGAIGFKAAFLAAKAKTPPKTNTDEKLPF